ncbi:MAG TPA: AMP-dependent synthetase/ligase [Pseudonocardiaceae bacterium]|jgi:long-chain acyl-CoA synthetase
MTDTAIRTATSTIAQGFVAAVGSRGDQTAVRWRDQDGAWRSWTTAELAHQVARAAAGLRALGVQPGQRVLMMMRNVAEFHVADLAVMFCGATPVSIYNSSPPEQIAYLAGHAEAAAAIVEDAEFLGRFDAVRDQLPAGMRIVLVRGSADGVTPWASLLESVPRDLADAAAAISPDTAATVIYTSGTTGPPKGVVLTHTNVCAQVAALRQVFSGEVSGKRVVSYLPMAHIAERAVSHYGMILNGYEISCCPDLNQLAEYLVQVRPQILFGVPRVWEKIRAKVMAAVSADPERAAKLNAAIEAAKPIAMARNWGSATDEQNAMWDRLQQAGLRAVRELVGLDQVEFAITGAAPIPVHVIEWYNALGVPLSEVYGMSENAGAMTWTPYKIKPGTVGPPVPGAEVRIAEDGEVLCRGPIVFPGYLKDPEQTAVAIDRGWLHTGDIGQLDEDGYLKIVDRKKELIITAGGKNISPANLEAALKTIPLVSQAFVVGDGQPYTAALLLLDPEVAPGWAQARGIPFGSLPELAEHPEIIAEIQGGVDAAMAPFNHAERVKKVRIMGVEWLPDSDELTPTAKLKRRVIKTKYATEIQSLYA